MKNKNNLNGGYIGLLVLLIVIAGGAFFVFRGNPSSQENVIQKDLGYVQDANEVKALIEQNNQKTSDIVEEKGEKEITNNNKKAMQATLHTNKGNITIELREDTPKTVENFAKLAKEGFYDDTKFHRVIAGFMSQAGDPLSKDDSKQGSWGTGGPGYKFEDELGPNNKNDIYTIAMANAGPNTNGSQFFINATGNNFLDTKHTVFGKIVAGVEVADAINAVKTAPGDRPLEPVIIESITLK